MFDYCVVEVARESIYGRVRKRRVFGGRDVMG